VNRITAVMLALFFAVRVSLPGIPAPVPVIAAFAAVIASLCYLIWTASGCRVERRAVT
jgi:hypothetical protein